MKRTWTLLGIGLALALPLTYHADSEIGRISMISLSC